ncbi:YveK family protein [Halobacillus yeomjeoni]|uniref:Capsular biosynthesis protein n=1 Tax=Halobacillus yeomjeoni TaxID=311194 RepID=A0A931HW33_9BACI|nr:Wzz/FepE/Etk N-terminal domain-containing protein [Halobacillus yeomjeoni]MBH0230737.1 capsular biosynthesis protein [Halobacillus yeomjeoni]
MEETISLKEIFEVLKKRMVLIISLAVSAAIISALVTFFLITPMYQTSSQFIVNQSQDQQQNTPYNINDIRTNVELINTYNVIIKSPRILDQVAEELSLNTTGASLANKIQVSNANESQVVNVVVTDADPAQAVAIANTTVKVFKNEIPQLMNVDNVNILDEAVLRPDPSPVSPNTAMNIAIAIVVGLMAGVGLAFLLEYLDNTIKSEEDIEQYLDLPLMGVVSTISSDDVVNRGRSPKKSKVSAMRGESVGT